jgi:Tol biopolymer transport system component
VTGARGATATGALLAAAALAVPATAGATWAGSPDRIAYGVFKTSGDSVHTVDPNGAHDRLLVRGAQDPEWSRGGGRIVFVTNRGLERMHADRTHRAVVVRKSKLGDVDSIVPSWSPNANRIAYHTATESGDEDAGTLKTTYRVWVVRRHGQHRHIVTHGHDVIWSLDGKYLYYVQPNGYLARIKPNGRGHHVLVRSKAFKSGLDLSPDGRRIVYATLERVHTFDLRTHKRTSFRSKFGTKVNAVDQAWAPRGRRIAFVHWSKTGHPDEIRTVRPNGTHVKVLLKFSRAGSPLPLTLSWRTR